MSVVAVGDKLVGITTSVADPAVVAVSVVGMEQVVIPVVAEVATVITPVLIGAPGPPGPQGPPGAGGGDGAAGYTHNQPTPSATWVVIHNLGINPGGIVVEDSGGSTVEGEVVYDTVNQLTLTFSGAFSGIAFLS